jgi:hypothetical protein
MVATSTTSFRQSAAVAVIAGAAVLASFGVAKGQQLAATDVACDRQTSYIETHCGPLAKASLECVTIRSTEFTRAQTAAAEKRIEQTDRRIEEHKLALAEARCNTQILEGLNSGDARFRPERGKAILNGKRPSEFGYCRFLEELKRP